MKDEFICEARVRFNGKDLAMNKIVSRLDLQEIIPSRNPSMDFMDRSLEDRTSERRQRFIDMVAAEFAHSLTEALFSASR